MSLNTQSQFSHVSPSLVSMSCFSASMWTQFFFSILTLHLPTGDLRSFLPDDRQASLSSRPLWWFFCTSLWWFVLLCIQTAAALQTWMLHYNFIINAKAEELNKICIHHKYWSIVRFCVWVQSKNLQRFLLILKSFHLLLRAAQKEMFSTGCSIKLCNTTCSTVHKNVPNIVLVLCCWVTGNG